VETNRQRIPEVCSKLHPFFKEKAMKRRLTATAAILDFTAASDHAPMSGEIG
jgi:hypothetical protein